ncbi:MAG TPA: N-acetylmuramoyl-L-alanine amidase [Phycisphaerae bacterium]|nr:N-acetylmuramoyl-L-alanine amidase [Phycisphaerae bacterium]
MTARLITGAIVFTALVGGCATPGVLRELPDPLFGAVRPAPAPAARPVRPRLIPEPVLPREPELRRIRGATVVVDAGHGGKDPGAQGVGPQAEKTVNLDIAMTLAQLLEERGARVVTTRNTDRFISLDERAALAERYGADLFVSIHADSAQRASATGTTVYIARGASGQSVHAAESIVSALERAGIECRGVEDAGFRVLMGHSRPAVLIECGFLSNYAEARRLAIPSYQADLAAAITDGIADHFSR